MIVHKEVFVYAKVKSLPSLNPHFFISKDADEITVITRKENVKDLDLIEKNSDDRTLLEIQFTDSSDGVGFIAAVSSALAEKGISISVISTYSKDYILVKTKDSQKAIQILTGLGFST